MLNNEFTKLNYESKIEDHIIGIPYYHCDLLDETMLRTSYKEKIDSINYIIEYHKYKLESEKKFLRIDIISYLKRHQINLRHEWIDVALDRLTRIKLEYIKKAYKEIPEIIFNKYDTNTWTNRDIRKKIINFIAKNQKSDHVFYEKDGGPFPQNIVGMTSNEFVEIAEKGNLQNINEDYLRKLRFIPHILFDEQQIEWAKKDIENLKSTIQNSIKICKLDIDTIKYLIYDLNQYLNEDEVICIFKDWKECPLTENEIISAIKNIPKEYELSEDQINYLMKKKKNNVNNIDDDLVYLPYITKWEEHNCKRKRTYAKRFEFDLQYPWWQPNIINEKLASGVYENGVYTQSYADNTDYKEFNLIKNIFLDINQEIFNNRNAIKKNTILNEFMNKHNIKNIENFINNIVTEKVIETISNMIEEYNKNKSISIIESEYMAKFVTLISSDKFDLHVLDEYIKYRKNDELIAAIYKYIGIVMGDFYSQESTTLYRYTRSLHSKRQMTCTKEEKYTIHTYRTMCSLLYIDIMKYYGKMHPNIDDQFIVKYIRTPGRMIHDTFLYNIKDLDNLSMSLRTVCDPTLNNINPDKLYEVDLRCTLNRYFLYKKHQTSIKIDFDKTALCIPRRIDFSKIVKRQNRLDKEYESLMGVCKVLSDRSIPMNGYYPSMPIEFKNLKKIKLKGIRLLQDATEKLTLIDGDILNSQYHEFIEEILYFKKSTDAKMKEIHINENECITEKTQFIEYYIYKYLINFNIQLFVNGKKIENIKQNIERNHQSTDTESIYREICNIYAIAKQAAKEYTIGNHQEIDKFVRISKLHIDKVNDDNFLEKDIRHINQIIEQTNEMYIDEVDYTSHAFAIICGKELKYQYQMKIFIKGSDNKYELYDHKANTKEKSIYKSLRYKDKLYINEHICIIKNIEYSSHEQELKNISKKISTMESKKIQPKILIIQNEICAICNSHDSGTKEDMKNILNKFDQIFIICNSKQNEKTNEKTKIIHNGPYSFGKLSEDAAKQIINYIKNESNLKTKNESNNTITINHCFTTNAEITNQYTEKDLQELYDNLKNIIDNKFNASFEIDFTAYEMKSQEPIHQPVAHEFDASLLEQHKTKMSGKVNAIVDRYSYDNINSKIEKPTNEETTNKRNIKCTDLGGMDKTIHDKFRKGYEKYNNGHNGQLERKIRLHYEEYIKYCINNSLPDEPKEEELIQHEEYISNLLKMYYYNNEITQIIQKANAACIQTYAKDINKNYARIIDRYEYEDYDRYIRYLYNHPTKNTLILDLYIKYELFIENRLKSASTQILKQQKIYVNEHREFILDKINDIKELNYTEKQTEVQEYVLNEIREKSKKYPKAFPVIYLEEMNIYEQYQEYIKECKINTIEYNEFKRICFEYIIEALMKAIDIKFIEKYQDYLSKALDTYVMSYEEFIKYETHIKNKKNQIKDKFGDEYASYLSYMTANQPELMQMENKMFIHEYFTKILQIENNYKKNTPINLLSLTLNQLLEYNEYLYKYKKYTTNAFDNRMSLDEYIECTLNTKCTIEEYHDFLYKQSTLNKTSITCNYNKYIKHITDMGIISQYAINRDEYYLINMYLHENKIKRESEEAIGLLYELQIYKNAQEKINLLQQISEGKLDEYTTYENIRYLDMAIDTIKNHALAHTKSTTDYIGHISTNEIHGYIFHPIKYYKIIKDHIIEQIYCQSFTYHWAYISLDKPTKEEIEKKSEENYNVYKYYYDQYNLYKKECEKQQYQYQFTENTQQNVQNQQYYNVQQQYYNGQQHYEQQYYNVQQQYYNPQQQNYNGQQHYEQQYYNVQQHDQRYYKNESKKYNSKQFNQNTDTNRKHNKKDRYE